MRHNLLRGADLDQPVTLFEIHCIEQADPTKVDDMLKVPTYKNVHAAHCCQSDIKGIRPAARAHDTVREICILFIGISPFKATIPI